ncbi:tripartite motif-containing protein 75-like [Oncorhynchus nerka]|uniref:tripartite motif-containing protein 75-like n=1 Tax=Oncorhynchus nerka TaxID=8023 RepID=UPI0031B7F4D6
MEVISLDEELICAVCRDIFVEPVTLPCGHNYCEGCVKELKRSAVKVENINAEGGFERRCICYTCPLCLAPCDSTLNLKNNVVLNNIIEKYHSKRASGVYCTVCKGDQRMFAEKSCVSCKESYCTVHIIPHLENAVLRQHVLVSPMGDTGRLCKEHGKELELYCETDQTPLCAYCMLPAEAKHLDGHNVVKLADALDTLRGNCHVKLQGIKERLTEVKNGLAKIDEAASRSKASLERQQSECTAFLRRIKLFLEFEEQAWQKRFSVDMVQESRNGKQRTEGLRRLQDRLTQAQDTLLKTQTISDPLVLLQLLKNEEWADLLQKDICSRQMQKLSNWSGTKLVASSRISPLFQTLQKTFQGDVIFFSELSAHPKLKLDPDSGSVWVTEEDQRHEEPCYLDRPYCVMGVIISSKGVHNWEVEVEGLSSWAVGVAFLGPSQIAVTCKLGTDDQSWSLSYSKSKQQFSAQHDWLAFAFHAPDSNPPRRIGVFLDVDSGILSFYDAVRMACLYTFYCTLDQDSASQTYLRPAFCPRLKEDDQPLSTKPMRVLRPVSNF